MAKTKHSSPVVQDVIDRFNTRESVVRIRCLDCDAVFEGSVSEVTQLYLV